MSGWIKLEKAIESDPRVLRLAKACVSSCNAPALHAVTLVVGALARLWMYADSHARDDDSLDLGAAEIDELLGIPGFCALMPVDWLRPIDENTVELPGFQEHNSVAAKRAALTTKRVTQHRYKVKRSSVTGRNAHAFHTKTKTKTIPDQDRDQSEEEGTGEREMARAAHPPDDDKKQKTDATPPPRKDPDAARAVRLPAGFELTAERRKVAETEHLDAERTFDKFTDHWKSASGANARKLDWDATWRNWCRTETDRNRGGNGGGKPHLTKFEHMQARLGDSDVDENGNPIPF